MTDDPSSTPGGRTVGRRPFSVPWGTVLAIFLATRIGFFLVAAVTVNYVPPSADMTRNFNCPDVHGELLLDVFSRWDSEWYLLIAKEGYDCADLYSSNPLYKAGDTAGFFPLYPLCVGAVQSVVDDWVLSGVIVSNFFFFAALCLLAALVGLDHSASVVRMSLLFMAVFPGAIFFGAIYSESLFLFLALGVVYASRRGWWWTLLPLGFCVALCRPLGLVLIVPAAIEFFKAKKFRLDAGIVWFAGFPAGLASWMIFCGQIFGDPFAFVARQTAWRGAMSGPWRAFGRYFDNPAFHSSHSSTIDFAVAVCAVLGVILFVRKVRLSYSVLAVCMVVVPLCTTLWSYTRLTAVVFPLFIGLAVFSEKRPGVGAVYVCLAPVIAGLLMALFASWRWAG